MSTSQSSTKKLTPAEESFEQEKAHITSYEEGWDRWDGPMWPKGTIQCELQDPHHVMASCHESHDTDDRHRETTPGSHCGDH
ncbi:uncharacterized protein BDR25DRAFT_303580 [Lindgomyces ingoldianus]|uniref:Uncharacterized protein n=1 Tax=Lindgomyces ingoldianus TaxID=673940 RepID=A0ACB6QVJ0_9PLEO|nr:uncharacterized protein BDR25DRAFT_303580 [Lindgomyces ingoldianus]KAF2471029.1 hypothetical protein BDR25DRAFT_303580 [Lindgomyces ingoldianus]